MKQSLNEWYAKIPDLLKNKYILTLVVFLLWLLFFDTNTLWSQFKMRQEIHSLKLDKFQYINQVDSLSSAFSDLRTNSESQEKFARETYYMKRDNEDVFIIEEEK